MNQELIVDQSDGMLVLTLNRPDSANALSPDLAEGMIQALTDASDQSGPSPVRCCVIRGNGRHFCAGFDLSDLESLSDGDLLWRFLRIETLLQQVHSAPFPVMALAQGQVIGAGADLFAACWQRIATDASRFQMPGWNFELALGTRRLTALVGTDAARDLLIDTRRITAQEAVDIGLATRICETPSWDEQIAGLQVRANMLSPFASQSVFALTAQTPDTNDLDLAAIVRTAGRPGLRDRIVSYRERVAKEREARRNS